VQQECNIDIMDKATIEMFNNQLATAKILLNTSKGVCVDLSHYIADNGICKIMMVQLIKQKGYTQVELENPRQYNFNDIVDTFKTEFPLVKVHYEDIKTQHSQRNSFQHKLITLKLGIRQEDAKYYIDLFQELMEKLLIFDKNSNFTFESSNHSQNLIVDKKAMIKLLKDGLIEIADKLKVKNNEVILSRTNGGDVSARRFEMIMEKFVEPIFIFASNNIKLNGFKFLYAEFEDHSQQWILFCDKDNCGIQLSLKDLFNIRHNEKVLMWERYENISEILHEAKDCIQHVIESLE